LRDASNLNTERRLQIDHNMYLALFERNLGVFSQREQEHLREAKVAIVGLGGIGGTVSIVLARSGVSNFLLVDPERYDPPDTNRQVGCFSDTIGQYKADVIGREILRINPAARVEIHRERLPLEKTRHILKDWDIVVAEADDLAYSSKLLYLAQELRKLSISAMPSGFVGYVMCFPPSSNPIQPETLFGLPGNLSYEELHTLVESPENKCGRRWYIKQGKWRVDWFRGWRDGEKGLTQICPSVWICACLAATEIIKFLVGRWKIAQAPHMWHIMLADNRIKVEPFKLTTRLFNRWALRAFSIRTLDIGRQWRSIALRMFERELSKAEADERRMDEEAERKLRERCK